MSFSVRSQLPSNELLLTVFILVQLTRVSCTVTAHVDEFTLVTHELEISLLALILIQVPAVYVVSTAEIVKSQSCQVLCVTHHRRLSF